MALYVKFKTKFSVKNPEIRFESAIKFFTILSKKIAFQEAQICLFKHAPLDSLNNGLKYISFNFGTYNTYLLKTLRDSKYEEQNILGFEIQAKIKAEEKSFPVIFTLSPAEYSWQEFDIRIEILRNSYAHRLEDLESYIPNFRDVLFDRIKEYEIEKSVEDYFIKYAVMSEHGEEERDVSKWSMFYSKEPEYLIQLILNSSETITKNIELIDGKKFSNDLLSSDSFVLSLDKYATDYNISIAQGSIFVKPESQEQMTTFVNKLTSDLVDLTGKIFKPRPQVKEEIDKYFSI